MFLSTAKAPMPLMLRLLSTLFLMAVALLPSQLLVVAALVVWITTLLWTPAVVLILELAMTLPAFLILGGNGKTDNGLTRILGAAESSDGSNGNGLTRILGGCNDSAGVLNRTGKLFGSVPAALELAQWIVQSPSVMFGKSGRISEDGNLACTTRTRQSPITDL
jgi:hypothetical protein